MISVVVVASCSGCGWAVIGSCGGLWLLLFSVPLLLQMLLLQVPGTASRERRRCRRLVLIDSYTTKTIDVSCQSHTTSNTEEKQLWQNQFPDLAVPRGQETYCLTTLSSCKAVVAIQHGSVPTVKAKSWGLTSQFKEVYEGMSIADLRQA